MKVCFYGNTGHFFTAFLAKEKLPQVDYSAFCPGFPGENMKQMDLFSGQAGCRLKEYSDLEEMLNMEKPDILVVDNRFTERCPVERAALSRGINVYADKPIATAFEDLDSLYKSTAESNAILWTMNTVRYDPWYYTAKLLIEQGVIGKIRMVNCQKSYRLGVRHSFYKERKYYGGTMPWVTIHAIDMIRMVTGAECESVYSQQSRSDNCGYEEMEIITTSSFKMDNDILATVSTDYYRPANAHSHDDDRMRVVGTKGIIEVVRREGDHEVHLLNDTDKGFIPIEQKLPPMIFEDFVHTIEGHGSGLLDMRQSFLNTYLALCAQKSGDSNSIVNLNNPKDMFKF